jgi:hypothetical protein
MSRLDAAVDPAYLTWLGLEVDTSWRIARTPVVGVQVLQQEQFPAVVAVTWNVRVVSV